MVYKSLGVAQAWTSSPFSVLHKQQQQHSAFDSVVQTAISHEDHRHPRSACCWWDCPPSSPSIHHLVSVAFSLTLFFWSFFSSRCSFSLLYSAPVFVYSPPLGSQLSSVKDYATFHVYLYNYHFIFLTGSEFSKVLQSCKYCQVQVLFLLLPYYIFAHFDSKMLVL